MTTAFAAVARATQHLVNAFESEDWDGVRQAQQALWRVVEDEVAHVDPDLHSEYQHVASEAAAHAASASSSSHDVKRALQELRHHMWAVATDTGARPDRAAIALTYLRDRATRTSKLHALTAKQDAAFATFDGDMESAEGRVITALANRKKDIMRDQEHDNVHVVTVLTVEGKVMGDALLAAKEHAFAATGDAHVPAVTLFKSKQRELSVLAQHYANLEVLVACRAAIEAKAAAIALARRRSRDGLVTAVPLTETQHAALRQLAVQCAEVEEAMFKVASALPAPAPSPDPEFVRMQLASVVNALFRSSGLYYRSLGAAPTSRSMFSSAYPITDSIQFELTRLVSEAAPVSASYIRHGLHSSVVSVGQCAFLYNPFSVATFSAFKQDAAIKYRPYLETTASGKVRHRGYITDYARVADISVERYGVRMPDHTVAGIADRSRRLFFKKQLPTAKELGRWMYSEVLITPTMSGESRRFTDAIIGVVILDDTVAEAVLAAARSLKPGLPAFAYDKVASTLTLLDV